MHFKIIVVGITLLFSGCSSVEDENERNYDLGSGNKSNLPISLETLIKYAGYSKGIYDSGGTQKDDTAFEVHQLRDRTLVVIRGTANASNVESDIDIKLVSDIRLSGMWLHNGFRTIAIIIDQVLQTSHTIENKVDIVGHSMGGAVAQLVGNWMHKRGHNVEIFSFGSPRVSITKFSTGQPRHWRIANITDPIQFMPPSPYIHSGVFINSETGDWGSDNDKGTSSNTNVSNHPIAKYVETLTTLGQ